MKLSFRFRAVVARVRSIETMPPGDSALESEVLIVEA